MIAQQEELDWEVYASYGLLDEAIVYDGEPLRCVSATCLRDRVGPQEGTPLGSPGTGPPRSPRSPATGRPTTVIWSSGALRRSSPLTRSGCWKTPEFKRRWASLARAHSLGEVTLVHKKGLDSSRQGFDLADDVRLAIADVERYRLVGYVLNTIDDALDRTDPGGTDWTAGTVQRLGHAAAGGDDRRPTGGTHQRPRPRGGAATQHATGAPDWVHATGR